MHIFTGENAYEIRRISNALIQKFVQEHGDLALERIDGAEVTKAGLIDAVQSMPFLATNKMVVVADMTDKDILVALAELDVPQSTELVVLIPKVDKRATYYKKLASLPGYKSFDNSTARDLSDWVQKTVTQRGGKITNRDAQYFIEQLGTNQLLLNNEIEKLLNYDKTISQKTIDELCDPLPQTSVFQLLDAAFSHNLTQTQHLYEQQRAQRVEPHAILGMIAWQLHILAVVKMAGGKSPDAVAKEARLSPFVVRKSSAVAKRLSLQKLQRDIKESRRIDTLLKTTSVDADQALYNLLVQLAM